MSGRLRDRTEGNKTHAVAASCFIRSLLDPFVAQRRPTSPGALSHLVWVQLQFQCYLYVCVLITVQWNPSSTIHGDFMTSEGKESAKRLSFIQQLHCVGYWLGATTSALCSVSIPSLFSQRISFLPDHHGPEEILQHVSEADSLPPTLCQEAWKYNPKHHSHRHPKVKPHAIF